MSSNISNNYRDELLKDLQDKEFRDAFVSAHINDGIPFQIRTMRNNRKLTQEDLGKLAKKKQAEISRLENPNYGSFTLKTLKEIASAFNVALIVRFVPFSDLVRWDLTLSPETLNALSYEDDPYFSKITEEKGNIAATKPYNEIIPTETSNKVINLKDYQSNISSTKDNKLIIQTAISAS